MEGQELSNPTQPLGLSPQLSQRTLSTNTSVPGISQAQQKPSGPGQSVCTYPIPIPPSRYSSELAWRIRSAECKLRPSCPCHAIHRLERPTSRIHKPCKDCVSNTCNSQACSVQRVMADSEPEAFVFGDGDYYHNPCNGSKAEW
jgi:hypothetical protein